MESDDLLPTQPQVMQPLFEFMITSHLLLLFLDLPHFCLTCRTFIFISKNIIMHVAKLLTVVLRHGKKTNLSLSFFF